MGNFLEVQVNGHKRPLESAEDPSSLDKVIEALELKPDRIAIELNGEIVRRAAWSATTVRGGDRLEIVHFVGGGLA